MRQSRGGSGGGGGGGSGGGCAGGGDRRSTVSMADVGVLRRGVEIGNGRW